MAKQTIIAWTDRTANFWMGCQKVSAGCTHCYAETLTRDRMGLDLWGPAPTRRQAVKSIEANIRRWRLEAQGGAVGVLGPDKPLLVFVGSLMDWAEDHPDAEALRPAMWAAIRSAPELHFQLLTKRADRIAELLSPDWGVGWPNVWLGVSIEDERAAGRADHLRRIPAAVRFVSYEPALGPLDNLDLTGISWTIYGGESGPGFRAENKDWARTMRAKCAKSGTAFFHKQSAGWRTEMGIKLDGEIVRAFPEPKLTPRNAELFV